VNVCQLNQAIEREQLIAWHLQLKVYFFAVRLTALELVKLFR